MNLADLSALATIITLIVLLVSIAFSARRYVKIAQSELEKNRFETYHKILKTVSMGGDESGPFKLASQIAYIYELRNFPEYSELTRSCLNQLRSEWAANTPNAPINKPLFKAIDETIAHLERGK